MNTGTTGAREPAGAGVYTGRQSTLWEAPELADLDAFLVTAPVHHRYLCGFSGSNAHLLLTADGSHFFTDGRYGQQSEIEVRGAQVHILEGPLRDGLKQAVGPGWCIGFEASRVTVAEAEQLRSSYPQVDWKPVEGVLERLRLVKDDGEVAALQRAAAIAGAVLIEVAGALQPGRTELEISGSVEESLRRHGSEGSAFEPIVASGLRSAMPHGHASTKPVQAGECVIIDFGAIWDGYHSDLTRTIAVGGVVGGMDPVFREWQEVLDEAIEAVLAMAQPGCPCQELDATARGIIDEAGFGDYFIHNLGHGIGLEVHEGPHLSRSSTDSLAVGMTFTIEPGIYVPDRGGMRIEENVVMTRDGPRLLTQIPRTLDAPGS